MEKQQFPIRLGDRSRPLLRVLFGVTPERAVVLIDDEQVQARFGRWDLSASISNIASWRIEGPWHWITAIGVRRSIRHGDLSFAGSPHGGVRMDFIAPLKWTLFHVPALYVGVEDLEGFAAALKARGIDGVDARRGQR